MMVFAILLSAVVAWYITKLVSQHALTLRLVSLPNHRSSHDNPTPHGGGLGIVVASGFAGAWISLFSHWGTGGWLLVLANIIAVVGLRDDIDFLPARFRLMAQIFVCMALFLVLDDLPALSLPFAVTLNESLLLAFLLLCGVWWINLFNFMDGIDGLAASQAIFMLLAAVVLAIWQQPALLSNPIWLWMLCLAAATSGFLLLNWPPAKIFMGDVGSTYLAFFIFALALFSIQAGWLSYSVWIVLSAVFVVDATITLLRRMWRGERWHEAHRSHAYQRLSRYFDGHQHVTLISIVINVLWLFPFAIACLLWSDWAWIYVICAYMPLLASVWVAKAGVSE